MTHTMLTADQWERVQQVFRLLLDAPADERQTLLERTCDDDDVRTEVSALLAADANAPTDFMQLPNDAEASIADPLLGRHIGRYAVRRLIAVGGMGRVYEAEQEAPHRIVALKVMRPSLGLRSASGRFRLEPEVLGKLQHPNIAHVYEAGLHVLDDQLVPYFALEYISNARPITNYADEHQLTLRARLGLFAQVCDAVHHGHQRGIIHRDLKPANILVGADGVPKVIDFGVARATDTDVALTTQKTGVGELIGTIQYMSPEQCDADPADLDTRTDVYSLGVVLYELLTGRHPYDAGTTIYHATRVIKDEPPALPSKHDRRLRGNIEALLLKALAKDRRQRYASAHDFSEDIRRHLAGEPLEARPPTLMTKLIRWSVRHPVQLTAGVCVFVAALIFAGTYASVWYLNSQPYRLDIRRVPNPTGQLWIQQAAVVTRSGRALRTWSPAHPEGMSLAEFVVRPAELGGGRLAIIGVRTREGLHERVILQAFDITRDVYTPTWDRSRIEDANLPNPYGRGYTPEMFTFRVGLIADVFTESPGPEVIVTYQHEIYSQAVLRVYNLRGDVLYQVWQDGGIGAVYWMEDPRLLIVLANSGSAYWVDRGYSSVTCHTPQVLFALRLNCGGIYEDLLAEEAGDAPLAPVWIRCILPPEIDGICPSGVGLSDACSAGTRTQASLAVALGVDRDFALLFDEHGNEVPGARVIGDPCRRALAAAKLDPNLPPVPDPNEVYLGDLPPIIAHVADTQPATAPHTSDEATW